MSARSMIAMRVMRCPPLGFKFARARLASARWARERAYGGNLGAEGWVPAFAGTSGREWRREAARETIKGSRRQDSEHRTGSRKFLQGFDPGFRKPDTA